MEFTHLHALLRLLISCASMVCLYFGIHRFVIARTLAQTTGSSRCLGRRHPGVILDSYVRATLIVVVALAGMAMIANDLFANP